MCWRNKGASRWSHCRKRGADGVLRKSNAEEEPGRDQRCSQSSRRPERLDLSSYPSQTPLDLFWSVVVDISIPAFKWWWVHSSWLNKPFLCAVLRPPRAEDPCPEWRTGAMRWRPRKCDPMSGAICIGQIPLLVFVLNQIRFILQLWLFLIEV